MAANTPITRDHGWFIGDRKPFNFRIRDELGKVIDVTNWDIEWKFKRHPGDLSALITYTTTGGEISDIDAPNGLVGLTVQPVDTIDQLPIQGWHALRRIDGANRETLIAATALLQAAATSA